jgi:hypothetical protein
MQLIENRDDNGHVHVAENSRFWLAKHALESVETHLKLQRELVAQASRLCVNPAQSHRQDACATVNAIYIFRSRR